jgi:hypothetical protein
VVTAIGRELLGNSRGSAEEGIRRDVDEARYRELATGFQKKECTGYVGLNDRRGLINAAIHVGPGGEMNHSITVTHGSFQSRRITDVALHKRVVGTPGDGVEIREVPGVCQLVIIDDGILLFRKNVADEIGTDESSATSH